MSAGLLTGLSVSPMPFQFSFQFTDPGFGGGPSLSFTADAGLGRVCAGFGSNSCLGFCDAHVALFVEGQQVALRRGVPPPQSPVFPAQVQSQRVTVPVKVGRSHLLYLDWLVCPLHQPVAGQGRTVMQTARGVKPPVFGDAERGVVVPFPGVVLPSRAGGGYFQHEVRRLTLVADGVASLLDCERPVHAEGDEQVRDAVAFRLPRDPSHRDLAQNDGGVVTSEVPAEGCLVGRLIQVEGVLHVVPGGEVWELFEVPGVRCLSRQPAGHDGPRVMDGCAAIIRHSRGVMSAAARWPGLKEVAKLNCRRSSGEQAPTETRYYVCSYRATAESLLQAARTHWGIENSLHWVLDMAFDEDRCRVRTGHADQNLAVARHWALNLLKQELTSKIGIKAKRKKAGWDFPYLHKVLSS